MNQLLFLNDFKFLIVLTPCLHSKYTIQLVGRNISELGISVSIKFVVNKGVGQLLKFLKAVSDQNL